MAAVVNGDASYCENKSEVSFKSENSDSTKTIQNCSKVHDDFIETWGFDTKELYTLATTFLKEKEGKAFQLSYKDKLTLVAFGQQVLHGKFKEEKCPAIGYFDVIGSDRRQAWQSLGEMPEKEAKEKFINLLHDVCPLFRPFVLAHKCDLEEKERRRILEEEERKREEEEEEELRLEEERMMLEEERVMLEEEARLREEREKQRQNHQKRSIQEALNRQTFHQFKTYAETQCPGNPEQQAILIRQLQEQHYQQYMQQVFQEQLATKSPPQMQTNHLPNTTSDIEKRVETREAPTESSADVSEEEICDPLPLSPASMWTRKDILDFKEAIRREGGDSIIKVGHGETVTVRVPTHDDGTCLFWEFATDSFDLGFGVYFEWTQTPDAQVTVHISESEDEEDEDEDMEQSTCDIEKGIPIPDRSPLSVIIPVYRRDCHEEVYAGSHNYPGQGVYLLKFDNSYSLWRSKTLYYRVYYTR